MRLAREPAKGADGLHVRYKPRDWLWSFLDDRDEYGLDQMAKYYRYIPECDVHYNKAAAQLAYGRRAALWFIKETDYAA